MIKNRLLFLLFFLFILSNSIYTQSYFQNDRLYRNVIVSLNSGKIIKCHTLVKTDSLITYSKLFSKETVQLSEINNIKMLSSKGRILGGVIGLVIAQVHVNSIVKERTERIYQYEFVIKEKANIGERITYPITGMFIGIGIGTLLLNEWVIIYSNG